MSGARISRRASIPSVIRLNGLRRGPRELIGARRARFGAETLHRGRERFVGSRYPDARVARPAVARVLFAITPLLYIAQQLLTHPRAILGGEMYAEMSTNYYATTQMYGVRLQLLAVDAGYIPLPQRIIGIIGWQLGLSPATIPYFYTASALLLSGLLVGAICLPVFRALIANDVLRFLLGLAILLPLDFETRLYINFTYLVVVPLAFLAALAFVTRDVPRWAWIMPVLMVSKPGVLTVLPAIVVAAAASRRRFRVIAAVCVVAAIVQVVRLQISSTLPGSLLQQSPNTPLVEKLVVAVQYTVGYLGRFIIAPNAGLGPAAAMLIGAVVLVAFLAVALIGRSPASALIVTGLSLVAANMLLSAVVYPNWFNNDMSMVGMLIIDRRVVITLLGTLIAVVGVLAVATESPIIDTGVTRLADRAGDRIQSAVVPLLRTAAVVALVVWMIGAGWVKYSAFINSTIVPPSTDVSEWETMAPALSSGQPVVCVPTAPFGWLYGRNCAMIAGQIPAGLNFQDVKKQADGRYAMNLPIPELVRSHSLAAVAVLVAPIEVEQTVRATLTVTSSSGDQRVIHAEDDLPLSGGALLFEDNPAQLIDSARSVRISFDEPVRIGWALEGSEQAISVLWMGQ